MPCDGARWGLACRLGPRGGGGRGTPPGPPAGSDGSEVVSKLPRTSGRRGARCRRAGRRPRAASVAGPGGSPWPRWRRPWRDARGCRPDWGGDTQTGAPNGLYRSSARGSSSSTIQIAQATVGREPEDYHPIGGPPTLGRDDVVAGAVGNILSVQSAPREVYSTCSSRRRGWTECRLAPSAPATDITRGPRPRQ